MLRILFILSFFVSISAFAADEDVEVVPTTEKKETVDEGSSENNRMGKTFLFDAQLIGVGPNTISSQGLAGGYFLNRNMLVLVDATFGQTDEDSASLFLWDSIGDYDIKGASIGVHFKHYVGNSFYYRVGVDYRTLDYSYNYVSTFTPANNVTRTFKGKSVGVTFAIGNQWQFKNFNLGCDWVGITVPLSSSFSGESVVSGSPTYDNARLNNDKDDYVKDTSINLLRFYLGASF